MHLLFQLIIVLPSLQWNVTRVRTWCTFVPLYFLINFGLSVNKNEGTYISSHLVTISRFMSTLPHFTEFVYFSHYSEVAYVNCFCITSNAFITIHHSSLSFCQLFSSRTQEFNNSLWPFHVWESLLLLYLNSLLNTIFGSQYIFLELHRRAPIIVRKGGLNWHSFFPLSAGRVRGYAGGLPSDSFFSLHSLPFSALQGLSQALSSSCFWVSSANVGRTRGQKEGKSGFLPPSASRGIWSEVLSFPWILLPPSLPSVFPGLSWHFLP